MPLTRKQQWDTVHLDGFLRAGEKLPFAWGSNDCALFAANAIEAMTGVDIADDFRGKYHDEAGAWALIGSVTGLVPARPKTAIGVAAEWCAKKHGLVEWTGDVHGWHARPLGAAGKPLPGHAKRGDLVVVKNGGRLIAGIVHPNGLHVVAMAETGIVRLPLRAVMRAWKV